MKRHIPIFILSVVMWAAAVLPVLAFGAGNYGLNKTAEVATYTVNGQPTDTIETVIAKVVTTFLSLMGFFFMALMLYGGLRWMTARGNDEYVEKSKNIIEAAIIGLVIILAAYAISNLIFKQLQG